MQTMLPMKWPLIAGDSPMKSLRPIQIMASALGVKIVVPPKSTKAASIYEVCCKKLAKIYRFLEFQWISILIHGEFSYMTQKYPLVIVYLFIYINGFISSHVYQ